MHNYKFRGRRGDKRTSLWKINCAELKVLCRLDGTLCGNEHVTKCAKKLPCDVQMSDVGTCTLCDSSTPSTCQVPVAKSDMLGLEIFLYLAMLHVVYIFFAGSVHLKNFQISNLGISWPDWFVKWFLECRRYIQSQLHGSLWTSSTATWKRTSLALYGAQWALDLCAFKWEDFLSELLQKCASLI